MAARLPDRGPVHATCSPRRPASPVDRYELPNLLALNFVIHGLLAPGVSGTTRPDAQAKGLGEYLRSRLVPVPADLLPDARPEPSRT